MELEAIEKNEKLWGEDLWNVFGNHINEEGWLTSEWQNIIEDEIPKYDKNYNDNPLHKGTYGRMYSLEYEESEDGLMIRPEPNQFF